jgi:hypothetical protein
LQAEHSAAGPGKETQEPGKTNAARVLETGSNTLLQHEQVQYDQETKHGTIVKKQAVREEKSAKPA